VGADGNDNEVDRAVHPTNIPNPSQSSGEAQPAADCSPPAPRRHPTLPPSPISAVGDPKVAGISSEPPPMPPRHRQSPWRPRRRQHPRGIPRSTKVCPAPLLSLSCLDKIRLSRPNLCGSDPESNRAMINCGSSSEQRACIVDTVDSDDP
jgi:hypothetical protein